ncbi:MAG: Lrp/AsnC family transcriptional regulator [Pseudomonadota bacterium]|jgi:DNA-binding Lrp family transcriptional regulator
MKDDLDAIDRRILYALQADARLTMAELAERVSLSHTPCWRRVKRLEEAGYISGYHAVLNRRKLGYTILGFVSVQLESHTPEVAEAFERQVCALDQVLSCHNLTGRYDYQLEATAEDMDSFARFVREKVRSLPAVREIYTSFSLKEILPSRTLNV